MIVDTFKKNKETSPEIVSFNPWEWAGQNKLLEGFFKEIYIALGRVDNWGKSVLLSAKWLDYANFLQTGSSFVKMSSTLMVVIGALFSSMGIISLA